MPEIFWSVTPLPHPLDCITSDPLGSSASSSLLHRPSPTISEAETWRRRLILYLHWFVYWCWGIRFHGTCSKFMFVTLETQEHQRTIRMTLWLMQGEALLPCSSFLPFGWLWDAVSLSRQAHKVEQSAVTCTRRPALPPSLLELSSLNGKV